MDLLIVVLIIIGIVNAMGSSKKKQQRQGQGARRPADESPRSPQAARAQRPSREEMLRQARRAQERQAKRAAVEARRANTPEDLQAHLAAMEVGAEFVPPPEIAREVRIAQPQVVAPAHGEGSASNQGESEAEHAEHRRRVAVEDAARRLEHETLRELREANRDKLRTAVIMSEILGKPASLRPRAGYHR